MEPDFGQPVTFIKGLVANICDVFRDLDGFQTVTAITEPVGNTGPAARNIYVAQVSAMVENITIDPRQTFRQVDFFNCVTILKHSIFQPFQAVRKSNLPQRVVYAEGVASD